MFINKFSMIKQYQYPILLTLKLTSGNFSKLSNKNSKDF